MVNNNYSIKGTECSQETLTSRGCLQKVSQKLVKSNLKQSEQKFGFKKKKNLWFRRRGYPKGGRGVVRARQPEMAEANNKNKIKTQTQIPAVNRGGRDTGSTEKSSEVHLPY